MLRFDRILGLLLFLRSGQSVSADELARHFAVSRRTIYRDLETLSLLGVPIYAERGRGGGFQLLEGYFLPPLMFSQSEAVALLFGISLQKNLRAAPFATDIVMAEQKLLAALPERLRTVLIKARQLIGIEQLPYDIFHPETGFSASATQAENDPGGESVIISVFLQAILDQQAVVFDYASYRHDQRYEVQATPCGVFWDRDHWYLVGMDSGKPEPRMWRSDRVSDIRPQRPQSSYNSQGDFDVREMLGRKWLSAAIKQWSQQAPVKIRLSPQLATRLQHDWYYRHASFEPLASGRILMTFGESDRTIVFELVRWLGPEAELLEPVAWRAELQAELKRMLAIYVD
ncbi:transcriptional regulator [Dictyobacter alpinus]|uniref:Transcriptional regulator n=1 Tax=Dictyobacter alpinus TaxID=2014873 RepID=A0A402BK34_9CHLR|nr:YafY family protein [Dictyobacter alpinus]GCE31690.1 transcriptional regulator [Dictyobacter alpinus]